MAIDKIIASKDSIYQKYIDKMEGLSVDAQELFLERVFKILSRQASKGYLDKGGKNLAMLNGLFTQLYDAMDDAGMLSEVSNLTRLFDKTLDLNTQIQNDLSSLDISGLKPMQLQQDFLANYRNVMFGTPYLSSVLVPINDLLFKAIVSGASLAETQSALKTVVGQGKLGAHTIQMTRDALYGYDGALNQEIAKEYGLNAYMYVGSIKPGKSSKSGKSKKYESRPQCVRWVDKNILLKSDLQDEINWAYKYGSGMIPGTTPDNFPIYRGGYNCRHQAIPTRVK